MGTTSPELANDASRLGIWRLFALSEKARDFKLMWLEDIHGEEVSEAMLVLRQSMEDGVIRDAEVSPEEI